MIAMKEVLDNKRFKVTMEEVKHELKNKYVNLLKDDEFKSLISNLHMSDEDIINYVYDLEDSLIECKNCKICKNLGMCKNKVQGFYYYPKRKDDSIQFSYIMCKYQKEYKESISNKNVYSMDIPDAIKNASMSDIYLDDSSRLNAIKAIKCFIDNYNINKQKGIYLHGSFGGGKTYLLSAAFNELSKKGVKSAIVYYPELLRNLKNFSEDFDSKFNYLKKVPLLLLDDIGAENVTGWNRDEILGPLLQYRMESYLPTFFTSNLNINELEEHFSITGNNQDKVKARRLIERILVLSDDIEMISENKRNK